ncbi:MAG: hypothetical protein P0120_15710 [Nitrospira sp.]|nr:hypothetical protein [Nitrospira sp.]
MSIQNLLTRNTGRSLSANQVKGLNGQQVDELLPNRDVALAIKADLPVMSSADEQTAILERTILERVTRRPPFSFLKSVGAIGEILALTIMLETGDIGRLCRVGNFSVVWPLCRPSHTTRTGCDRLGRPRREPQRGWT